MVRAHLVAAQFSPSPGCSSRPSDGRGVRGEGKGERGKGRGEGGRFGPRHFHELLNPRRGVGSPESQMPTGVLRLRTPRVGARWFGQQSDNDPDPPGNLTLPSEDESCFQQARLRSR